MHACNNNFYAILEKSYHIIDKINKFTTYEEACAHAKTLQTIDTYFNVFVGEMGKWLPFDPNPDSVKDSEYANEQLNNMMKSYAENQEKAKIFHEHRKNELIRNNILENLQSRNENLKELKEKKLVNFFYIK